MKNLGEIKNSGTNIKLEFLEKFEGIIKSHYPELSIDKIEGLKIKNGMIRFEYSGVIHTCPFEYQCEISERVKRVKIIEKFILDFQSSKEEIKKEINLILIPEDKKS